MKASELRIGNFVMNVNTELQVCQIFNDSFQGMFVGGKSVYTFEHSTPIPLTEEWLLKFGFEKKPVYGWKGNGYDYQPETSKTECQDYVIDAGDEDDFFFVRYSTWSYREDVDSEWTSNISTWFHKGSWYEKANAQIPCTQIGYVHQLQNLYFALTGEELTIQKG
jgi:hypothetical protein